MGNTLQPCSYMDCFYQCFGRQYKRWLVSKGRDHDFPQGAPLGTARKLYDRHRRISDYLSWALRRSRAPLLLDDVLASEVNACDFRGVNSTSWISDTAGSDASHALYREVDPYNYPPMEDNLSLSSASSLAEGLDRHKGGGSWIAVTKLTGPSNQTATSLVFVPDSNNDPLSAGPSALSYSIPLEEELDGLELARNLRSRCSDYGGHGNRTRGYSTRQPISSITSKLNPVPLGVSCPAPQAAVLSDPTIGTSVHPKTTELGTTESPVDLAWDHEPGAASPHVTKPTVLKPRFPYLTQPYNPGELSPQPDTGANVCLQQKLYPTRPRRRGRKVALLPVSGDEQEAGQLLLIDTASTNKRWSYSDNLLPATASQPGPTAVAWLSHPHPDSGGVDASGGHPASSAHHPTDELFDSGFVGLGNSVTGEEDRISQTSESLLWENEVYTSA